MKFLVFDIETTGLDINTCKIKFINLYDPQKDLFTLIDYEAIKDKQNIINLFHSYDKLIGFNSDFFDVPILKNHGILTDNDFYYGHFYRGIDVRTIYMKRATLFFPKGFKSLSLKNISKDLFPDSEMQKGEIDFKLFQKPNKDLTKEELELIKKYGELDVRLTWRLWEVLVKKFEPFKEFFSDEDVIKLKYLTSSTATMGYKMICKAAGISELWADTTVNKVSYEGAFVQNPLKEKNEKRVLLFDWSSLYPMIFIQANLFSTKCERCSQENKWHGGKYFKVDGYYCKCQNGKIEQVLKNFYLLRKKYKKENDSRQHALKIALNAIYGSANREGFVQTYSKFCASDCTSIAREVIHYSIKQLEENGYGLSLYADTDSIFLEVAKNKTDKEIIDFTKKLAFKIASFFPFPWSNEFSLKLETPIKYIQFFKSINSDELLKKNYLYITENNELIIKGLPIIEKSCSQLSQLIFEKYLKSQIIKNLDCKFSKKYIKELIEKELKNNLMLIAKKFDIKNSYNCDTTLYNLIKENYGSGEIYLVKNKILGAGKKVKYCSLEEALQLNFNDLDLSDIWNELDSFLIKEQEKQIGLDNFGINKDNMEK